MPRALPSSAAKPESAGGGFTADSLTGRARAVPCVLPGPFLRPPGEKCASRPVGARLKSVITPGPASCPHCGPMPSRAGPSGTLASKSLPCASTSASSPLVPKVCQHEGTRRAPASSAASPALTSPPTKGAGKGGIYTGGRPGTCTVSCPPCASLYGAAHRPSTGRSKNVRHGHDGGPARRPSTRAAPFCSRNPPHFAGCATRSGQHAAALRLPRHGQPRHDVRPGPGLRVQKTALPHNVRRVFLFSIAGKAHGAPVH